MRRRVFQRLHLVEGAGDDLALMHDHGPDRHLLALPRAAGLAQGFGHEKTVAVEVD